MALAGTTFTRGEPSTISISACGHQETFPVFRSATSVAANYAEAEEAESRKDFIHKLKIAMKELSETRVWLKVIVESGYAENRKLAALIEEAVSLTRIFSVSIITARKNQARQ